MQYLPREGLVAGIPEIIVEIVRLNVPAIAALVSFPFFEASLQFSPAWVCGALRRPLSEI
jgi:hypothetical protein